MRIGELSAALEKIQATPKREGKGGKVITGDKSTGKMAVLKAAGISPMQASRSERLARRLSLMN